MNKNKEQICSATQKKPLVRRAANTQLDNLEEDAGEVVTRHNDAISKCALNDVCSPGLGNGAENLIGSQVYEIVSSTGPFLLLKGENHSIIDLPLKSNLLSSALFFPSDNYSQFLFPPSNQTLISILFL
uniref:Uncharacterized protein n=1 Tax=Manihot esculenta TaxID=3983 RepID=A0A2C9W7D6_MANES